MLSFKSKNLTLKEQHLKTAEFPNSVDSDEMAPIFPIHNHNGFCPKQVSE